MIQQPANPTSDTIKVQDGRLIVDVSLQPAERSKSGKTMIHYSTHGFVECGEYTLAINLVKK